MACARSARRSTVHELAGDFPIVDALAIAAAREALDGIAAGSLLVIDGLALPAFADLSSLPRPWVALVHHPLALETGLGAAAAEALARIERRALAAAARVIVTSPQTRARSGRLRRGGGAGSASCCRAPSPPRSPAAPAARARAALRRFADAAQGPSGPARRACRPPRSALAADLRRQLRSRPGRRRARSAPRSSRLGLEPRVRLIGEQSRSRPAAVLRRGRPVRAGFLSRGLRHGAGRGAGARPAGGLDHRGRDPGHGAGGRGHPGPARRSRSARRGLRRVLSGPGVRRAAGGRRPRRARRAADAGPTRSRAFAAELQLAAGA